MPRPQRIREREALAVKEAPAKEAAPPPADENLDQQAEQAQSSRSGVIEEDAFVETLAKRLGWTPKEDWTREPTKWLDPRAFLERTPDELTSLRERQRRMGQVAEAQAAEAARIAREEALGQIRTAAEAGNADQAVEAGQKLAAQQPHPLAVAWMARNPWFDTDPAARAVTAAVVERERIRNASIQEQLDAAEAEVRRRFPEHFGQSNGSLAPEPRKEARLSEVRQPPLVQGGSRGPGGSQATKEKGWGDIPAGDRGQMGRQVQRIMRSHGKSEDQVRAMIATAYWAEHP